MTTPPRLTTMEALAQIIRKWRLIERTSKIDLCRAASLTPSLAAIDTSCVRVCVQLAQPRLHSEANNNNS